MTTWTLSGFGDEIDADPVAQLEVLAGLGARHIEVRSAWEINVVDLDDDRLDLLAAIIRGHGFAVSAVASPIGKVPLTVPVDHEVERLRRIIRVAEALGTSSVRVFSFYAADGIPFGSDASAAARDAVLRRMAALAREAESAGVTLLHENEKGIYGDVPVRVLDLIESIGSPALRVAWDPANFVQVGVAPFTDGYALLRPHLAYLQVKDALAATGAVVPSGAGDGQLPETIAALRDDGYVGVASLEPHLTTAEEFGGFSGPDAFGLAARAFRDLTHRMGVTLE